MTSSRGANIPSEPTRSFSKHMRAVDTLTPRPSHTPFTSHLLHAGSLSSLCSHALLSYVSCSQAARCARLRSDVLALPQQTAPGMRVRLLPPPALLVVNEWQQGWTGRTFFHCNIWTPGLSHASWMLGAQTGKERQEWRWMGGFDFGRHLTVFISGHMMNGYFQLVL